MENICKSYGRVEVVKGLDITVESGEKLILLGPSGCGKSTILRMIAGLEDITSGELYLGGQKVNHLRSGERNVSMVFQNYALFPHMTVEDNITYGLRINKVGEDEVRRRKTDVVKMLELSGLENRKPRELSGGQRQRVALARAVAKQSSFLLLDEPLSNLDVQLREHARKELVRIHEKFGQTMVYVTHDQVEAMTVGDRIALFSEGTVQMLDTPQNVYNHPANVFTARFIGSPSCNIIGVREENGGVGMGGQVFFLDGNWAKFLRNEKDLYFGVRPEHIDLSETPRANSIKGVVKYCENYGHKTSVFIANGDAELVASAEESRFYPGDTVYMTFPQGRIHFFDKKTGRNVGYPENIARSCENDPVYKRHIA
jgi:sn-glycerol 3-phosphate transport system ATP-binding protein